MLLSISTLKGVHFLVTGLCTKCRSEGVRRRRTTEESVLRVGYGFFVRLRLAQNDNRKTLGWPPGDARAFQEKL